MVSYGRGSCLHFSTLKYQIIREHNVLPPTFNVNSKLFFFLFVCSVHAVGSKGSQSFNQYIWGKKQNLFLSRSKVCDPKGIISNVGFK